MAADDPDHELQRIAAKILELTDAHKADRRPYLMSALGIDLGDDLKTLKQLTNKGLNDFIQSRLAHRLTLVRLGAHRNVAGVIDQSVDPEAFDAQPEAERADNRRFHHRFWAAFSVPSKGNKVRVLNPDNFAFEDKDASDVPDGALTVASEFIVSADANDRDEKIKENIAAWLADKGLSEERFTASKRPPKGRAILAPSGSLLEAVISALDRRQLQSTSLSLDIVATLLKTPRG